MLPQLLGALVCCGFFLSFFVPELVTSRTALRQVHAAAAVLAFLFLMASIVRTLPGPPGRSTLVRVVNILAWTGWWSYMAVWDPLAPTGPGTLPTLVARSIYTLAGLGVGAIFVAALVRSLREAQAGD